MPKVGFEVEVIGNGRGASQAFRQVEKDADRTSGRISHMGESFKGAGKLAGVGLLAVGAGAAGAAAWGLKVASANEQAQIGFTTMLGSAKKASAFLGDLQAFAAKTPFEFPELQTAASSLISVGVDASKVIPIMTTLGNVTSGMGTGSEGVKRATVALQQMSAAGRITGEDLNQLRDAGIPVFDLLAGATGKSKAEIVKLAQAGKLGKKELDQMMKALETGKGLERFSGLMEKQSESLSGMISTLKDTLGQGLAKAMTPLVKMLKDVLPKIMGPLGDLLDTFSEAAASVLPLFAGVLSSLMPVIQAVAGFLAIFADRLGKILMPVLQKIAPFVAQFVDALGQLLVALMPLLPPIGQILIAIAPLLPLIAQLATVIVNILVPPLTTLLGWVAKLAAFLTKILTPAIQWVQGVLTRFGKYFLIPIAPIVLIVQNLKTLKDVFSNVLGAISRTWSTIWNGMKKVFSDVWGGIKKIARDVINGIITGINFLIGGINKIANAIDVALGPFINLPDVPRIPKVPAFAAGGIVPGPVGRPQLAVVHGGEEIIPPNRTQNSGSLPVAAGSENITINLILDGQVLATVTRKKFLEQRRRSGPLGFD